MRAFYVEKRCRLSGRLVTKLLERFAHLGWCLAPMLVQQISGARDVYLRGEACNHLGVLVHQRGALGVGARHLEPHVDALQSQLLGMLRRGGLKSKHVLPPLRLAAVLIRALRAHGLAPRAAAVCSALVPCLAKLEADHAKARSVVSMCMQIRQLAEQKSAPRGGGADGASGAGGAERADEGAKKKKQKRVDDAPAKPAEGGKKKKKRVEKAGDSE